jgi:hypothetical protein
MNLLPPPPASPGGAPPSDGDIDTLLSAFFRAEMPDPWPTLRAPAGPRVTPALPVRPSAPPPRRRTLVRSRLALAASVALLVAGALFRAGRPDEALPRAADPGDVSPPSANAEVNPRAVKPAARQAGKMRLVQKKDATYIEAVEDDGPPMPDK